MRAETHFPRSRLGYLALSSLAATLLVGCPTATTGSAPAETSGSVEASDVPCRRSLSGDLKTARDRLDRGHPDEALVYVDAMKKCDENLRSLAFMELASEVYEELGELNLAWWALTGSARKADPGTEGHNRVLERTRSFQDSYVLLKSSSRATSVPEVNYLGAVLDVLTEHLLDQIRDNLGVDLGSGSWGFWLFPGRYEIMGRRQALAAGETLDLSDWNGQ
jgi:hypothetical protein